MAWSWEISKPLLSHNPRALKNVENLRKYDSGYFPPYFQKPEVRLSSATASSFEPQSEPLDGRGERSERGEGRADRRDGADGRKLPGEAGLRHKQLPGKGNKDWYKALIVVGLNLNHHSVSGQHPGGQVGGQGPGQADHGGHDAAIPPRNQRTPRRRSVITKCRVL